MTNSRNADVAEKGEASRQPEGKPRLEPQQAVDMTETSSWEEQGADPPRRPRDGGGHRGWPLCAKTSADCSTG